MNEEDRKLLREIRDGLHGIGTKCAQAHLRGFQIAFNIDVLSGKVDLKFSRLEPVNIDEG